MPEPLPQTSMEREPAEPCVRPDLAPPDWDEIEQMLDELPPGIPILPPEDATNFSKYRYPPPMMPAPQAWKTCTDAMEKYDSELCKAYREEIDTLLVFAGLFSAVVTGFTIESYQWLQDDPADTTNALLAQIARSLAPNGTAPVLSSSPGMGRSVSARINAYWFISLALSLSAALVAILGKQWIREFERRTSDRSPKELIGVRQLKLEGLQYWKVGEIISALPMLLQLSLALFALGILELLWHLHTAVAVTVGIPTAAAIAFYSATTVLPVIQYSRRNKDGPAPRQCAYKSPQALAAMHIYQIVARAWRSLVHPRPYRLKAYESESDSESYRDLSFWNECSTGTWAHWDTGFYLTDRYFPRHDVGGSPFRGLHWLSRNVDERNVQEAFWNCLWDEAHSPDAHPADRYFSRKCDRDTRLRRGIMQDYGFHPTWALWQCAVTSIPRRHMAHECISELLIQCLPTMDVLCANSMFFLCQDVFSNDPELVRSLVKAVLSYGRQHINENISGLIARTSDIVARCPDDGTQLALQWVLVSLAANWQRSLASHGHFPIWQLEGTRRNIFECLSHSPEDFVHHPQRLHRLPHILALATLRRAEYESRKRAITCGDSLEYLHFDWKPMAKELLKISVYGVDRDSPIGTSEHTNGRRDSIAHEDLPLLEAVPPAGADGTAAAETLLPSEAAQIAPSHIHNGTLSAASLPSPGGSPHGQDARESPLHDEIAPAVDAVEIIIAPSERDVARTSSDAALLDSHLVDDTSVQDAGGVSALAADRADGDSMDVVHAGDAAVRAGGDPHDVSAAPPQATSGRTPLQTGGFHAEPPSQRSRDPPALALPDATNAQARETAPADEPGGHVGVHHAAEQLDAASGVRAGMPPLQSATVAAADDRSSAVSGNADVSQTLAKETATGTGGGSGRAADEGASVVLHAPTEQPELSIPLESHRVHRGPSMGSRARDAPSTEEGRARRSTDPAGQPETQRGERAGETDETPQKNARARKPSGHMLEASSIHLEPNIGGSTAADAASLHSDDQSAAEGTREQPDEIGGGGEPLGA